MTPFENAQWEGFISGIGGLTARPDYKGGSDLYEAFWQGHKVGCLALTTHSGASLRDKLRKTLKSGLAIIQYGGFPIPKTS